MNVLLLFNWIVFHLLLSIRSLCLRVKKLSLHQDGLENNESGDARKTKIVRPEDKILEEPVVVKGIRGRRRVLCPVRVAPANGSNRPVTNISPPQQIQSSLASSNSPAKASSGKSTPVTRAAQSRGRSASPASPSPVRPNRTSALRQNTTQSQKTKSPSVPVLESQVRLRANSKSPRVSSAPCSPRQLPMTEQDVQQLKRRSLEMASKTINGTPKSSPPKSESVPVIDPQHPPLSSLGKQGTFTKEKSSSPETAAAKLEEDQSVKIPPKVPPKPKIPPAAKPALPKKPSRFNNGPSPLSSPRSKGSPALSRRSVSSASIGSDSTSATTTWSGVDEQSSTPPQKRTPPKKVVASKIASLWKQVEESRSKQKNEQPDVRKWISRGDSAKPNTEDKAVGTASPEQQTPRPIVSSGTFEKLSSFSNTQQVPVITPTGSNSPSTSDKRSPPSRLPFRLPRFGRSSQSTTPTTPTLPTPPSPGFDVSGAADTEDKRKFRVTAL